MSGTYTRADQMRDAQIERAARALSSIATSLERLVPVLEKLVQPEEDNDENQ